MQEALRQAAANGSYLGYQRHAANKLYPKLPIGHESWEDLLAEMQLYTLEAIEMYDPNKKAKFTTFLYRHLQIRCLQWFNWAWLKQQTPYQVDYVIDEEGFSQKTKTSRYVYHFTQLSSPSADTGDARAFDPGRSEPGANGRSLEWRELMENVSEPTRRLLNLLLGIIDEELIKAFGSKRYRANLEDLLGLPRAQSERFVAELREVAPKYLSAV